MNKVSNIRHAEGNITYFRRQALEKGRGAFVFEQIFDDGHTADFVFKVRILDTRFDGVQWSSYCDGSHGTSNGSDEILRPSCLGIVLDTKHVLFCYSRSTEQLYLC